PRLLFMTNQTVWAGCPSLHSRTRLRANSEVIGPLAPSETVRRYQPVTLSSRAIFATARGGVPSGASTCLVRVSPRYLSVCTCVASRWRQHRVSSGIATHATVPTHASQAAQNSGLFP